MGSTSITFGDDFDPGLKLTETARDLKRNLVADRGWQSSGAMVMQGQMYRFEATGRITLADDPKPWVSEPDGVTIRYAQGHPIGRVLGVIIGESDPSANGKRGISPVIPPGTNRVIHHSVDRDAVPAGERLSGMNSLTTRERIRAACSCPLKAARQSCERRATATCWSWRRPHPPGRS